MKFTANVTALAPVIRRAAKVPPTGANVVPALQSLCLNAAAETLTITAVDTAMWFSETVNIPADQSGVASINAKELDRILSGLPDGADVEIEKQTHETSVTIRSARSRWVLPATDPDVLTTPPPIDGAAWDVPGTVLLDALKSTAPTMGMDEARYYLKGVHVSVNDDGDLRIQSGNGPCITRVIVAPPEGIDLPEKGITLPDTTVNKLLTVLTKAEGSINIAATDALARIDFGETSITTRLNDSEFPNTDRIVPSWEHGVTTPVRNLAQVVSAAMDISDAKSDSTSVLEFQDGEIRVTTENRDGRNFEGYAPAEIEHNFARLGINARLLASTLHAIGENEMVRIGLKGDDDSFITGPVVFTTENAPHITRLISPLRI
jgi:DNA polymerase III sliding clamp (beta) subunit (PCNA family)